MEMKFDGDKIPAVTITVDEAMLTAAMKKAVETKLVPKHVDTETYTRIWDAMKQVLQAALAVV
jgi:hypothetical protein